MRGIPLNPLHVRWLGRIRYEDALEIQIETFEQRSGDKIPDQLLLLEHPPVYTRGSKGIESDIKGKFPDIPIHKADRGGATTYHGPGQLVGYPIIKLEGPERDLHAYVRSLERVLIEVLAEVGLDARTSTRGTGVWIGERKIASIGVRVARWITRHGFALNVNPDLRHFEGIVPCGLSDVTMTSIEKECGEAPELSQVATLTAEIFARVTQRKIHGSTNKDRLQPGPSPSPHLLPPGTKWR